MSHVMVIPPICRALLKSEDELGAFRVWRVVNKAQSRLLADFSFYREELSEKRFSEKELRAWASRIAAELNAILIQEGFSIQLRDFGPDEFGVVSILDVLVDWVAQGRAMELTAGRKEYLGNWYPGVHMISRVDTDKKSLRTFSSSVVSCHNEPIVALATQSGDVVTMTIADRPYADFDLVSRIETLRLAERSARPASYLMFPMVDLNVETSLEWLIGMHTIAANGNKASITQALQQTKFKMNEFGARVKSGVALRIRATVAVVDIIPPIIIDKPFFLWIERPGMSFPLMYAYVDEVDWKNPGDLSNM